MIPSRSSPVDRWFALWPCSCNYLPSCSHRYHLDACYYIETQGISPAIAWFQESAALRARIAVFTLPNGGTTTAARFGPLVDLRAIVLDIRFAVLLPLYLSEVLGGEEVLSKTHDILGRRTTSGQCCISSIWFRRLSVGAAAESADAGSFSGMSHRESRPQREHSSRLSESSRKNLVATCRVSRSEGYCRGWNDLRDKWRRKFHQEEQLRCYYVRAKRRGGFKIDMLGKASIKPTTTLV